MEEKYRTEFADGVEYRTYEIPEKYSKILDRLASKDYWGKGENYVIFPDDFLKREDVDEKTKKEALILANFMEEKVGVVGAVFFKDTGEGKWKLRKKVLISS